MNKMNTPISDFVKAYSSSDTSRFHMPGHKGASYLGCEKLDITEISGADVLGSADGIIASSEANAASLFNAGRTFYSTEGSSLCIKAMLALIKKNSTKASPKILATRNAHKAFVYACALLGIDPEWIFPQEFTHLCSCDLSCEELDEILAKTDSLPDALYITSPDYLGNVMDVRGLSAVCHKYKIPLLVDNAHGAYLAFLNESQHPIALGADMCCDSAHKTLPVLTGGAYLHVSKNCEYSDYEIRNSLSLFASTSPSYLILQSLDICNKYLSDGYKEKLDLFINQVKELRKSLSALGFSPADTNDELKLVFSKATCGYSGNELAKHLSKFKIEVEFADCDFLVLMLTPELTKKDFDRLISAFEDLPKKEMSSIQMAMSYEKPISCISIRDAVLSPVETICSSEALGRVCASPSISCPPAVPIVISGEIINQSCVELLLYYGIEKIEVLKQKNT